MKLISMVIIAGLILLYFMDAAFKIHIMNAEMLIHSGLRFFTGFILVGIGVFYAHKLTLKSAVYLIFALVLGDDIVDYVRSVEDFRFEITIHGIYMLLWGSLTGYVLMKQLKNFKVTR
ncbi:MAG: hypothetical protein RLZZ419_754 [Pseudomonadota bacterium]|jgi:hypothetical protein